MERIVIDTSTKKEYELVDAKGNQIGVIEVDLTDLNIMTRADEACKNVDRILKEFAVESKQEDIPVVDAEIREQINYIFGENICDIAFKDVHCLSLKNGKTLAERFLNGIIPVMKRDIENEAAKVQTRKVNPAVHQYTAPYQRRGKGRGKRHGR